MNLRPVLWNVTDQLILGTCILFLYFYVCLPPQWSVNASWTRLCQGWCCHCCGCCTTFVQQPLCVARRSVAGGGLEPRGSCQPQGYHWIMHLQSYHIINNLKPRGHVVREWLTTCCYKINLYTMTTAVRILSQGFFFFLFFFALAHLCDHIFYCICNELTHNWIANYISTIINLNYTSK